MTTIARSPGMVTLYRLRADGSTEQVERWPVDARTMLAFPGAWSLTPPDQAPVTELPQAPPLDPAHLAAMASPAVTRAEDASPATVRPTAAVERRPAAKREK